MGTLIPRFDPNAPNTFKYEVKKGKLASDAGTSGLSNEHAQKERYYDVNPSLKSIIGGKKKEEDSNGFSLLKLLGRDHDNESDPENDNEYDHDSGAIDNGSDKDAGKRTDVKLASKRIDAKKGDANKTEEKSIIGKNLFREKFELEVNDPRLEENPFFDPKLIKRLKETDVERRKEMAGSFSRWFRMIKKQTKEQEKIGAKIKARKGHLMKSKAKSGKFSQKKSKLPENSKFTPKSKNFRPKSGSKEKNFGSKKRKR